jgi:hypothetical protein
VLEQTACRRPGCEGPAVVVIHANAGALRVPVCWVCAQVIAWAMSVAESN